MMLLAGLVQVNSQVFRRRPRNFSILSFSTFNLLAHILSQAVSTTMANLNSVPNELILAIGELCLVPDLARLARVHRRFSVLLSSEIYKRNFREEPYRESCLLYAASYKRMDILKIALAHGADMNGRPILPSPAQSGQLSHPDPIPTTGLQYNFEYAAPRPLHVAVWNGDLEMVEFLLEHGAITDASWVQCEDDDRPLWRQSLPSFLENKRVSRKPLPPSAIRSDLTLDLLMREANRAMPINALGSSLPTVYDKLGVEVPRELCRSYPLMFGLCLPLGNSIGSLLIRKGGRYASYGHYEAFSHAIVVGNIRLFNELLQCYPAPETWRGSAHHRALCTLSLHARRIPMQMMRHAFTKLLDQRFPQFLERAMFGGQSAWLAFYFVINGRFDEALSAVEETGPLPDGIYRVFRMGLLHHVWLHDAEEIGASGPRALDLGSLAIKHKLTKALLRRPVTAEQPLPTSHMSEVLVTPLYLAARGSAGCLHRTASLRLMLAAGHDQSYVARYSAFGRLSLLHYFLGEAGKERNVLKFEPLVTMCLEFGASLYEIGFCYRSGCSGPLEFSIMAWQEPGGKHPLFELLLKHATHQNVNVGYVRFLLRKDLVRDNPRLRDALFIFVEEVLGETVVADGPPPASVVAN